MTHLKLHLRTVRPRRDNPILRPGKQETLRTLRAIAPRTYAMTKGIHLAHPMRIAKR
jgi:hypothetical protein